MCGLRLPPPSPPTPRQVKLTGSLDLPKNEADIQKWLYKNGPVSIGVNANPLMVSRVWRTAWAPARGMSQERALVYISSSVSVEAGCLLLNCHDERVRAGTPSALIIICTYELVLENCPFCDFVVSDFTDRSRYAFAHFQEAAGLRLFPIIITIAHNSPTGCDICDLLWTMVHVPVCHDGDLSGQYDILTALSDDVTRM